MIQYLIGDATEPVVTKGIPIIAHIVNNAGKWGAGFSGALSAKWKRVEEEYRAAAKRWDPRPFDLGYVLWTYVDPDSEIMVCNMIAQHDVRGPGNPKPIRYDALDECLDRLAQGARSLQGDPNFEQTRVTIHGPRFGAGLAGGDWNQIEALIEDRLWDLEVYIYDLP